MSTQPVRWGISSTGRIAGDFARALRRVPEAQLVAVSSRTKARAEAFAAEHGATRAFGSLSEMVGAPEVDIVYVASPHSQHRADALQVVDAGKHVLVEKPFGLSSAQAREVFDAAARSGAFVMEALWSKFLPAHVRLRELAAAGAIGEVLSVDASFGFPFPGDPGHRLLAPELGGGALLDLGIYPVSTAMQLLGVPVDVVATAALGATGVDVNTAVGLRFAGGAVATAQCSLVALLSGTATVMGTEGIIEVPGPHHCPEHLTLRTLRGSRENPGGVRIDLPVGGDGLRYQVEEVHACLRAGKQQSEVMSWQHTLDLMGTLDGARASIGLRYPTDP